jgi:hypothetical protein
MIIGISGIMGISRLVEMSGMLEISGMLRIQGMSIKTDRHHVSYLFRSISPT